MVAIGVALPILLFAILRATVLSELPCPNAGRVALLFSERPQKPGVRLPVSGLNLRDLAAQMQSIDEFGPLIAGGELTLRLNDGTETAPNAYFSGALLPLLGVSPIQGRWFDPDEESRNRHDTVVISEHFWRSRLGADPRAIGATLQLQKPATIVGVIPSVPILGLLFGRSPDVIFPVPTHLAWYGRDSYGFQALVRLRPGASISQARSELEVRAQQLRAAYPRENNGFYPRLVPIRQIILGRSERLLWFLFLAAGVVWLIAAANFGALLAVRLEQREPEFAIRCAIGARLGHLLREVLREVATVSVFGTAAGVFMAWLGVAFIKTHAAWFEIPRLSDTRMNAPGLIFGISASLTAGLLGSLVNLAPLIRLYAGTKAQKASMRSYSRSSRFGRVVVAAQFCLSLVVVNVAGMAGRSLVQTENHVLGYDPRAVVAMQVWTTQAVGDDKAGAQRDDFRAHSIIEFAQRLPHVRAATACYPRPTSKEFLTDFLLVRRGIQDTSSGTANTVSAVRRDTAPNYFEVMGVPLLRGRFFLSSEGALSDVVIVNAAFVRAYSPGAEVVGRYIAWKRTGPDQRYRIAGVVGDSVESLLDDGAQPTVYFAGFRNVIDLLVRTEDARAVLPELRKYIRTLDSGASILQTETLEAVIQAPLGQAKTQTMLSTVFAVVSVLLAAAGLYGNVRHAGESHLREYTIRLALGATEGHLARMRLRHTIVTASVGLAIGVLLCIASGNIARSALFRVKTVDPWILLSAAGVLMAVALGAAWVSIRERSTIEPSEILRSS